MADDRARGRLTVGAATPAARLVEEPTAEVRFGLVLYGGVSLAIYIYGVVYEFWRLVKASEDAERNAWSELLEATGKSAAVDIVSGTSAGGINGLLLGKALVRGGDLEAVRGIWVDEADFSLLLQPQGAPEPSSLLRTEHFESLMSDGLARLDPPEGRRRPLTRVFDLFVAATRLRPWQREFATDLGGSIATRQYRKRFQLKLRTKNYNPDAGGGQLGYDRDDFAPENNRVLAEVARATSAFPGAFEPRRIERDEDSDGVIFEPGEPDEAYFSDGGILHNKPFTETLDAIFARAADLKVERWLVSVEPDPEGRGALESGEPELDEVLSKSIFGIPRYQSIAADLERIEAHRRHAARQRDLLDDLERRIMSGLERRSGLGWTFDADALADPRIGEGERAAQFCADLAGELARFASLSEAQAQVVEQTLRAAVNQFGESFDRADFSFERRRIYFLLRRLRARLADPADEGEADLAERVRELWACFDRVGAELWAVLDEHSEELAALRALEGVELSSAVYELASRIGAGLAPPLEAIREQAEEICTAVDDDDALGPGFAGAFAGALGRTPERVPMRLAWSEYRLWDMFVLPVDPALGFARDEIKLARVSPEDAGYIRKPAEEKLAGDSLGHFGGFLKREWRENDILWGRLDAAEQITRMVGAGLSEAELEPHIRRVQGEIFAAELEQVASETAPEDYREYLERSYDVGSETLAEVDSGKLVNLAVDTAGIARNMLGRLERAPRTKILGKIYRWVGGVLGALLAILRWPVRAIWGDERPLVSIPGIVILIAAAASTLALIANGIGWLELNARATALVAAGFLLLIGWTVLMSLAWKRRHPRRAERERSPPGPPPTAG